MRKINAITFMLIILVPILISSSGAPQTYAQTPQSTCVCGPKQTYIVLVEFADVKHDKSVDVFEKAFRTMNSTFYRESYGKVWLTGEVKGWFALSTKYSDYKGISVWGGSSSSRYNLVTAALRVSGLSSNDNSIKLFVFAGRVWGFAFYDLRIIGVNEDSSWRTYVHEMGHIFGLPDLYLFNDTQDDPTHFTDIMAGGTTFSAWSRMKLGWISQDMIQAASNMKLPTGRITITDLDDPSTGPKIVKITIGPPSQYYLVERRLTSGLLFYVDETKGSGGGILTLIEARELGPITQQRYRFAVIMLGSTEFSLIVGTLDQATQAEMAVATMAQARSEISKARSQNRTQGLIESQASLQKSLEEFSSANFAEAKRHADLSQSQAASATVPAAYEEARQLLVELSTQLAAANFTKPEAQRLLNEAMALAKNATRLFNSKEFESSKSLAQQALELLNKARTVELSIGSEPIESADTGFTFSSSIAIALISTIVVAGVVGTLVFARSRKRARISQNT